MTLTERQREVYDYIRARVVDGMPPTIREIGAKFSIRSPNGVVCHLEALQRKGLIYHGRRGGKSRAIRVVEDPARTEALAYLASLPTERLTAIYRYERDSDGMVAR